MWKNYEVPQGFVVYIYNWGAYNLSGLSPKHTYDFLSEQMKLFRKNNVKAIYICGSTDLWGLEGPAYYVFYRLMENANLSPSAFGKTIAVVIEVVGSGLILKPAENAPQDSSLEM